MRQTIAEELGLDTAEVEKALQAGAEATFEAHGEDGGFEMHIGPGPGPVPGPIGAGAGAGPEGIAPPPPPGAAFPTG